MSDISVFNDSAERLYEETLNYLPDYWAKLGQQSSTTFSINSDEFIPWFGNFVDWVQDVNQLILDFSSVKRISENIPASLRKYPNKVAMELNYLLPDTQNTRALLPCLLVGYSLNRKGFDVEEDNPDDMAPFADKLLYERPLEVSKEKIKAGKNFFILAYWKNKYKALKRHQISLLSNSRALHLFSETLLFLKFLCLTRNICNVTLSFCVFSIKTGLLELLGDSANLIIVELKNATYAALLDSDPLKDKICSFADAYLADYLSNQEFKSAKIIDDGIPISFAVFLASIRKALSKPECNENETVEDDPYDLLLKMCEAPKRSIVSGMDFLDWLNVDLKRIVNVQKSIEPNKQYRIKRK